MGRLFKHLFTTTTLLTTVAGGGTNLQLRSPKPQILSFFGSALGSTLNGVGETIGNVTTTAVGGVLGSLNISLATAADFLTPALQSLITVRSPVFGL